MGKRFRNFIIALGFSAAIAVSASPVAMAESHQNTDTDTDHKVTLCHATDSNTNPYVTITVDTNAAGGGNNDGVGGHASHTGPIWNATLKDQHIKWGDIIPSFDFGNGDSFAGLNWTAEGQAIFNNDCQPTGGQGGGETPPPVTPPTTPPTGGVGGETGAILGATTSIAAANQGAQPTQLPNTGLKDGLNPWIVVDTAIVLASGLYWRRFVQPLIGKNS